MRPSNIDLTRKEDGHWLSFSVSNGDGAVFRIESLESKLGYIAYKALIGWAKEQVGDVGADMADGMDKLIEKIT